MAKYYTKLQLSLNKKHCLFQAKDGERTIQINLEQSSAGNLGSSTEFMHRRNRRFPSNFGQFLPRDGS